MNYLVMENHRSYSIVLDEQGLLLKVANLRYEVGQTVDRVYGAEPETETATRSKPPIVLSNYRWKGMRGLAAAAAVCVILFGAWHNLLTPRNLVQMQINPDVLIKANRLDYVLDVEGLNADGQDLIEDLDVGIIKTADLANRLTDRALEMGYLRDGGEIRLLVSGNSVNWRTKKEAELQESLQRYIGERVRIEIVVGEQREQVETVTGEVSPGETVPDNTQFTIPVELPAETTAAPTTTSPPTTSSSPTTEAPYDDSDYGTVQSSPATSRTAATTWDDSDYDDYSDYDDTDYENSDYDD